MPRRKAADLVEELRRQQAKIAAKLKDAEAKARERQREDNQRRETIAGRVALAHLAEQPESGFSRAFAAVLDAALTRPADRALDRDLLARRAGGCARRDRHARDPQDAALRL